MDETMLFESEVPPKDIFKKMEQNVFDNYYHNAFYQTNREYISIRSSLFSILHKVCERMGFRSQTFFLCIQYLDIVFSRKRPNIPFSKYNTVGLACLCLSAKFCENDPIVPHLQYFVKVYNNLVRGGYKNTLTKSDLLTFEVIAIKILNHKLDYYTIYDFDSFFWGFGIVKIEQLTDINYNGYSRSHSVKKVIEKIYKKSREYLDIIINNWKISMKFNSLMLSLYIMKKSVEEVLLDEKKFSEKDNNLKENFIKKNNLYFKEIMVNIYKIDYEKNAQYKEIINDDEINKIFKYNETRNLSPAAACIDSKENKKNDKENNKENNKENKKDNKKDENNKYKTSMKLERNIYSTYTHNSTGVNFYKKNLVINKNNIKGNIKNNNNNNINKTKSIVNLKKAIDINEDNDIDDDDIIINNEQDDDIDENLNIDEITNPKSIEIRNSYRNKVINNNIPKNSNINPRDSCGSNKNISKTFYKKLNSATIKSNINMRSSKNYNKNDDNEKTILKKINNKTQKSSPQKVNTTINQNTNLNNYSNINKLIKNRRVIPHNFTNFSNLTNNSIIANNSCNIEENKTVSKPYYKKFIHQNTDNNIINSSNIINNNTSFNNSGTNFYPRKSNKLGNFLRIGLHKQIECNINKKGNIFDIANDNTYLNNSIEINSANNTARKYKKKLNYNLTSNYLSNNKITKINKDASTFDNENKQKPEIESYNKFRLTIPNSYLHKSDKKEVNSERELPNKRRSYLLLQKNTVLNNNLKEINRINYEKNNDNELKKFEKEDEKIIMNKTSDSWMNKKLTVKNYSNIRDKYKSLKTKTNNYLTDTETDDKDNIDKIENNNKNNEITSNKFIFRNSIGNLNHNNSSIKSSRANLINKNNDNGDQSQSSLIKFLTRTKTIFGKKEENKAQLNNKESINKSNTYLFKKKTDYTLNNKTFDESLPPNKNTYYKNIIGKNKLIKNDLKNDGLQKNVIVNNNKINKNVIIKNSNLNNDKYKNRGTLKKIDTGFNNSVLLNSKTKANNNQKIQNQQNENGTFNSLLNRISFYKKNANSSNISLNNFNTNNNDNQANKKAVNSIRMRRNMLG